MLACWVWDSFAFFYWKNGPRNNCFLVKNGSFGTVLRFFLKRQLMTKYSCQALRLLAIKSAELFCHSCGVEIRALRAKILKVLRTKIFCYKF